MPERVSDERLIKWRDDAGYRGMNIRVEESLKLGDDEKIKLDLLDARRERDALRAAVREARNLAEEWASHGDQPEISERGHELAAVLRDATEDCHAWEARDA